MNSLELLAYLAVGLLGAFATLVLFAAVGASVVRKERDEYEARKQLLEAQRREELLPPRDCQPVRNHAILGGDLRLPARRGAGR